MTDDRDLAAAHIDGPGAEDLVAAHPLVRVGQHVVVAQDVGLRVVLDESAKGARGDVEVPARGARTKHDARPVAHVRDIELPLVAREPLHQGARDARSTREDSHREGEIVTAPAPRSHPEGHHGGNVGPRKLERWRTRARRPRRCESRHARIRPHQDLSLRHPERPGELHHLLLQGQNRCEPHALPPVRVETLETIPCL